MKKILGIRLAAWLACMLSSVLAVAAPQAIDHKRGGKAMLAAPGVPANAQLALAPGRPTLLMEQPLQAPALALVRSGHYAFVAAGEGGLQVFDLAAASPQRMVAQIKGRGRITAVQLRDGYVYLADSAGELLIVDVGDPQQPQKVFGYSLGLSLDALYVERGRAYVASAGRFDVLDVSNPRAPQLLASHALADSVSVVQVVDGYAYLAQPHAGLRIFDVRDPAHIRETGLVRGETHDVVVAHGMAYLANGAIGLTLLDVSAPQAPRWVGSINHAGKVLALSVEGDHVAACNDRSELMFIDAHNPVVPRVAAVQRMEHAPCAIALAQGQLLTGSDVSLELVDFSAPLPNVTNVGANFGGSRRAVLRDNLLYVADWFSGLHIYDVADPAAPRHLSNYHTQGSSKGVLVHGDHAFVADDDHGVQILDISDPQRPRKISEVATPGLAYTMKLVGDHLYLADHRGGFHIIDIADLEHPAIVGSAPTAGKAWAVEVVGGLAYVAASRAGLLVFDVSDPARPTQLAAYDVGGEAEDVVVRGHYAYVASFDSGLHVFDIERPMQAREVGHFATSGNARGIELDGDLAYVADWASGILAVNVADPARPFAVGAYDTDGWAWGVRVRGHYAYVLDWWGGVTVLDVADPAAPVRVGAYHARGLTQDVTVRDGYACVADGVNGLQVFDVRNPLNPIWMAGVDMAGDARGVWLDGKTAYVAAGEGGLAAVDMGNPFEPRLRAQYAVEADAVRAGGGFVYAAKKGSGVAILDAASGQRLAWRDVRVNDLWLAGGRLLLATPEGVEMLDVRDPQQHHPRLLKRLSQPAGLVRVQGRLLALYEEGAGILLYDLDAWKLLGRLNPGKAITDMQIAGKRLYASGSGELLEIDIASPRHPRLRAVYPVAGRVGKLGVTPGSAFVAGNDMLAEVRLLPDVATRRRSRDKVSVEMPRNLPLGSYDLLALDPVSGQRIVYPDVMRVVMPPSKKPRFTMQDLERAMRKRGLDPKRHQ